MPGENTAEHIFQDVASDVAQPQEFTAATGVPNTVKLHGSYF